MKRQMKLNYNGFVEHIADVLAADDIETVQNEAWSIEVGIQLLNGYKEIEEENQTNADIIRSMEDAELATLLQHGCCKPYLMDCPQVDDCRDCWLDWLKQEADNDP